MEKFPKIFRPTPQFLKELGVNASGEFINNPQCGIEALYTKEDNVISILDKNSIPKGAQFFLLNPPAELYIGIARYIQNSKW